MLGTICMTGADSKEGFLSFTEIPGKGFTED
jgi:hypothetical protein